MDPKIVLPQLLQELFIARPRIERGLDPAEEIPQRMKVPRPRHVRWMQEVDNRGEERLEPLWLVPAGIFEVVIFQFIVLQVRIISARLKSALGKNMFRNGRRR